MHNSTGKYVRRVFSTITISLALLPIAVLFQNCGEGFEAVGVGEFSSKGNGDPLPNMPTPNSPLTKLADMRGNYNVGSCCGFYGVSAVNYPYVYFGLQGYRGNLTNGEIIQYKDDQNYGPDGIHVGITANELIFYDEATLQVTGKVTLGGPEFTYRFSSFNLSGPYILISRFDSDYFERGYLVVTRSTGVVRAFDPPRSSGYMSIYPTVNSPFLWVIDSSVSASLYSLETLQVVRQISTTSRIDAGSFGSNHLAIYEFSGEAPTTRLADLTNPTAEPILLPFIPVNFNPVGIFNNRIILVNSSTGEIRSMDIANGQIAPILPEIGNGLYVYVNIKENLMVVSGGGRNFVYNLATNEIVFQIGDYDGIEIVSSNYLSVRSDTLGSGIWDLSKNAFAWRDPNVRYIVNPKFIPNRNQLVGSMALSGGNDWFIAHIDLTQGRTLRRMFPLLKWTATSRIGNSISFYSDLSNNADYFIGNPLHRSLLDIRKRVVAKGKFGGNDYMVSCTLDNRYQVTSCDVIGVSQANGSIVSQFTFNVPAGIYFGNSPFHEETGTFTYSLTNYNVNPGTSQIFLYSAATNTATEIPSMNSAIDVLSSNGYSAIILARNPGSTVFSTLNYSTRQYQEFTIPVANAYVLPMDSTRFLVQSPDPNVGNLLQLYNSQTGTLVPANIPLAVSATFSQLISLGNLDTTVVALTTNTGTPRQTFVYDFAANQTLGSRLNSTPVGSSRYGRYSGSGEFVYDTQTKTLITLPNPEGLYYTNHVVNSTEALVMAQVPRTGANTLLRINLVTQAITNLTEYSANDVYKSLDSAVRLDNGFAFTSKLKSNGYKNDIFVIKLGDTAPKLVSFPQKMRCAPSEVLQTKVFVVCNSSSDSPFSLFELDTTRVGQ